MDFSEISEIISKWVPTLYYKAPTLSNSQREPWSSKITNTFFNADIKILQGDHSKMGQPVELATLKKFKLFLQPI